MTEDQAIELISHLKAIWWMCAGIWILAFISMVALVSFIQGTLGNIDRHCADIANAIDDTVEKD